MGYGRQDLQRIVLQQRPIGCFATRQLHAEMLRGVGIAIFQARETDSDLGDAGMPREQARDLGRIATALAHPQHHMLAVPGCLVPKFLDDHKILGHLSEDAVEHWSAERTR